MHEQIKVFPKIKKKQIKVLVAWWKWFHVTWNGTRDTKLLLDRWTCVYLSIYLVRLYCHIYLIKLAIPWSIDVATRRRHLSSPSYPSKAHSIAFIFFLFLFFLTSTKQSRIHCLSHAYLWRKVCRNPMLFSRARHTSFSK